MGACTSKANRSTHTTKSNKYSVNTSRLSSYDIVLEQMENNPDPNLTILSNYSDEIVDTSDDKLLDITSSSKILSPSNQLNKNEINDQKIEFIDHNIDEIDEHVYIPPQYNLTIGDHIEIIITDHQHLQYILHGYIRFIGHITGKNGIFYGIRTNASNYNDTLWKHINKINGFPLNQNNGYFNKICYFKTTDGSYGLFVTKQQITRVTKINFTNPRVGVNEEIYVPKYNCNGIIKYIGKTELKNDICYRIQLHNRCNSGSYDALLNSADLSHLIIVSKYNLLIHGIYHRINSKYINIASGIIKLIECYYNKTEITLISNELNCKQYQLLDINNNICGPTITVKKCGSGTQSHLFETNICGYYQFIERGCCDMDDYGRCVIKTEVEILKLKNGKHAKRIFRTIESVSYNNNQIELPCLIDYTSARRRNRHNYHQNNVDGCDHVKILNDIACLYGLEMDEINNKFGKRIQLYGLIV